MKKTIKIMGGIMRGLAIILMAGLCSCWLAGQDTCEVRVSWPRNTEPDIAGYRLMALAVADTSDYTLLNAIQISVEDTAKTGEASETLSIGLPGMWARAGLQAYDLAGNYSGQIWSRWINLIDMQPPAVAEIKIEQVD
jgi:hypothetical protein